MPIQVYDNQHIYYTPKGYKCKLYGHWACGNHPLIKHAVFVKRNGVSMFSIDQVRLDQNCLCADTS